MHGVAVDYLGKSSHQLISKARQLLLGAVCLAGPVHGSVAPRCPDALVLCLRNVFTAHPKLKLYDDGFIDYVAAWAKLDRCLLCFIALQISLQPAMTNQNLCEDLRGDAVPS